MSRPSSPNVTLDDLGVPAEAGSLVEVALTHRSFAFEQPEPLPHNERLEFLGDAVLGLVVTDFVFRNYPDMTEGEMARLRASVVNNVAGLAEVARELGLGAHLRLGKGEESSGGRDKSSILADSFEALLGANYLERGLDAVADVLVRLFATRIEAVVAAGGGQDAKGALQELVARTSGVRPTYRVSATGPDHDKRFTAHVFVDDELYGEGAGRSKREAELTAARCALDKLAMQVASDGRRSA